MQQNPQLQQRALTMRTGIGGIDNNKMQTEMPRLAKKKLLLSLEFEYQDEIEKFQDIEELEEEPDRRRSNRRCRNCCFVKPQKLVPFERR